ncbi:MAG: MogA/MoaB family molybdenum cofactor biosynthesis protein, partial [Bryobacteraceae bacterium]
MITVSILTVSDSAASASREDLSGPALRARCEALGWQVVGQGIVPDDVDRIQQRLVAWSDGKESRLILTTGGTGVAVRDITPEATRAVIEREIPGLEEMMRSEGRKHTKFAALSRGVTGTRGETLIVNLPGSPKGARESLDAIQELIPHVLDLVAGKTEH